MANRKVYVGDSYPPLRLQLQQGQQILDLRPAESIVITFEGKSSTWTGSGSALWPFQADPNGMNRWNMSYIFDPSDTATADTYSLFVTVTWPDGVQTFSTADELIVAAKAVTSASTNDSISFPPQYPYNQPASSYPKQSV
jgi:hypothetical protein